jgi:methyl-accepting chemotaxis protein
MGRQIAKSGEGVVRYYWNKPKAGGGGLTEEAYLKLAFVKLMPGKNWMFGTGEYADYIDNRVGEAESQARADARNVLFVILCLATGIFAVNVLVVVYFTSRIAAPIGQTVRQLHVFSGEVNETANQLSAASQNLAEGATEQAASLEEISASLTELSSRTDGNAQNARQSKELTDKTQAHAAKGGQVMAEMVTVIDGIKDSSDRTAKIVKSIDELAFQTNLLALNAAVEAARAGESGSGFAVVAEEVRNLAQRSATAAQETARLIQESQDKANLGVNVAKDLGKVLADITEGVRTLSGLVAEVATASAEQAEGMSQVSGAVAQIDSVTQRTAAHAEESASAGAELRRQASEVSTIIRGLTQVVGEANGRSNGASTVPASVAAAPWLPARLS